MANLDTSLCWSLILTVVRLKKKKVLLVVTQAFDPSTQKVERQVDV